jgi:hypothetical protein
MALTILAVCLIITLASGYFRAHKRRQKANQPPLDVDALEKGVPTFRVVALGLQGLGKTLLLASMYQHLQVPAGRSYFLSAPFDQVILLNKWFTQIADTSKDWPAGTTKSEMREFVFDVKTRAAGGLYTILRLGYLEYAGELLTEPQPPGSTVQADLIRRMQSADALVGIIDGFRIRQYLDRKADGNKHLQQLMTAMINPMIQASSPITFIITKWDLLTDLHPDENKRLNIVRNILMNNEGFRELVNVHSAHRVVRLVPVSAVGPEFATIDGSGAIVKRPEGQVHPTHVDVPLSAVVPDIFEQVENALDDRMRQAVANEARRQSRLSPAEALANAGIFVSQAAGRIVLTAFGGATGAAIMGQAAVGLFLDSHVEPGPERPNQVDRRLSEAEQRLDQFRVARRRVLREFQSKVDVLEGRLPSSRLTNGQ